MTEPAHAAVPGVPAALRWYPVWRRNLLFWRKLAFASMLSNFGEPVLYLLALGYGLGALVGQVGELSYLHFLASGFICSSCMVTATFEATYSAYSRMVPQHTWDAMISAPLDLGDVVLGEVLWAATKSTLSACGVFAVAAVLGVVSGWQALLVLPAVLLCGVCFASMAMVVTALARSYDFFLFYTTLVVTPMFLLSGVFFPVAQMPPAVQALASLLPLSHAVALVRPLATGTVPGTPALHLAVLAGYALAALAISVRLIRRRILV